MTAQSNTKSLIDAERLWQDLMSIAEITNPEQPYTRRAFTPLFMQGREWLRAKFQDAGFEVIQDAAGNLIGRIEGTANGAETIMTGSHSDTVPGGGRFDGVAGVIAALEIGRAIKESGTKLRHSLEVVDFLAEEPNVYGLSCVGSRGITGNLSAESLQFTEPGGETLAQAIERVGGRPAEIGLWKRSDIRAFFELHIEQGPILEHEKIDIGLVTAIVGIRRIEIIFEGEADHAGTTPMDTRRDAGVALAESIVLIRNMAEKFAHAGEGHFVATVGVVEIQPNAMNVVPERARLIIDARSESRSVMDQFTKELTDAITPIASKYRCTTNGLRILSDSNPSICDPKLRMILAECARDLGFTSCKLASGAGHDAAFISRVAPMAMAFIPCLKGKSHAPEEWADPAHFAAGTNVLAEAILRFDKTSGDKSLN